MVVVVATVLKGRVTARMRGKRVTGRMADEREEGEGH